MKTTLKKVYECEHCKRKMLAAGPMARHEKYCRLNPTNRHRCFNFCLHLKRQIVMGGIEGGRTEFTCEVTGKKMYSYLLEKKASLFPYHIKFDGMERMPLTCDVFMDDQTEYDKLQDRFSDFE
jgi:hypothetical protein